MVDETAEQLRSKVKLSRPAGGSDRATYRITRRLFLRFLAVIYGIAFASMAVQAKGLYGSRGISPIADFPKTMGSWGVTSFWQMPTVFWFVQSDWAIVGACWAGVVLSAVLLAGFAPAAVLILLWLLYLSITNAGDVFMHFQWDILLLEAGFLAIFFAPLRWRLDSASAAPPSRVIIVLLRWLLFRLMFLSGLVKLTAGDPSWPQLTALTYHYETQPLPTWIGWYLHQMPPRFHELSTAIMFAIELIVPFFILGTQRMRQIAFAGIALLMMVVGLSGNYNFFNLLTVALCIPLLDDATWRQVIPARRKAVGGFYRYRALPIWLRRIAYSGMGAAIVLLSIHAALPSLLIRTSGETQPSGFVQGWNGAIRRVADVYAPASRSIDAMRPFRITSVYGLFRHMTKQRPEIVIEGSNDGQSWREYEFRWKPGDLSRAPGFCEPHQPRLDWQMWFAALGRREGNPWLIRMMRRILEGSEAVLGLLEKNPFPDSPPKYVRALLYDYKFTDLSTLRETGQWWRRRLLGIYCPPLWLSDPARVNSSQSTNTGISE